MEEESWGQPAHPGNELGLFAQETLKLFRFLLLLPVKDKIIFELPIVHV